MADGDYHVFLSHSRNDPVATADVLVQLRRCGLDVFKDDESIKPSDEWLVRLQAVLEGCGAFVVLVGRDGVGRWIGAETQVALNRHFGPHDEARRLPIFPILLDGTEPEALPPLLRLFQVTRWSAGELLPADLLAAIRGRNILKKVEPFAGCPSGSGNVSLNLGIDAAYAALSPNTHNLDFFDSYLISYVVLWTARD